MSITPRHSLRPVARRSSGIALGLAALIGVALAAGPGLAAETGHPFNLTVENASAKVGEPTVVLATITVHDGYKVLTAYRNRIIELSSMDDTVTFAQPVVAGTAEGETGIVFSVGVTPTAPGEHPINGVFRVGYHDGHASKMVSVPLKATVTGTE